MLCTFPLGSSLFQGSNQSGHEPSNETIYTKGSTVNWAATTSMNAIGKLRRGDWFGGWRNWATAFPRIRFPSCLSSLFQKRRVSSYGRTSFRSNIPERPISLYPPNKVILGQSASLEFQKGETVLSIADPNLINNWNEKIHKNFLKQGENTREKLRFLAFFLIQ